MIRIGDIIITLAGIAIVSALAASVYSGGSVHTVQIMGPGHVPADYPAWQDRQVRVTGPLGDTLIEIRGGRARVLTSPCTQKLCLRAGWLDSAGAATACVPNRVSVALLGDDPRFDALNF